MITLKKDNKEFKLVPRTRKVIDLTERLKAKNLNDLMFEGLNNVDVKMLAEIIKAFAEYEDKTSVFSSLTVTYDFIDDWKNDNQKSYSDLYKLVIEVTNEMGFFKNKMTKEELDKMIENPVPTLNIKELAINSAQKIMDSIAEEEFKGYKG